MKTWVHRIEKNGGFQFLTNAEFAAKFHSGEYKSKNGEWLPFKVDIPDTWKPMENKDGSIMLHTPSHPELWTRLEDVLTCAPSGRPCLVKGWVADDIVDLEPLEEVLY